MLVICNINTGTTLLLKTMKLYNIVGGPTLFSPRHRNLDLGMEKMGKKVYGKRGKQTFYFKNRKNSHFCP